jgi:hypothetical protein
LSFFSFYLAILSAVGRQTSGYKRFDARACAGQESRRVAAFLGSLERVALSFPLLAYFEIVSKNPYSF